MIPAVASGETTGISVPLSAAGLDDAGLVGGHDELDAVAQVELEHRLALGGEVHRGEQLVCGGGLQQESAGAGARRLCPAS